MLLSPAGAFLLSRGGGDMGPSGAGTGTTGDEGDEPIEPLREPESCGVSGVAAGVVGHGASRSRLSSWLRSWSWSRSSLRLLRGSTSRWSNT